MSRILLFDYGVGNLHSLEKALSLRGDAVFVSGTTDAFDACDAVVLPGVGAFPAAARALEPGRRALHEAIRDGLPCFGICLGMQLLFESSEEGPGRGLAVIGGHVRRLRADRLPQMGWNSVTEATDAIFRDVDEPVVYYANTFVAEPADPTAVSAWSTFGQDRFPAAVRHGAAIGVQFHPEKSGETGLRIIAAFLDGIG